MFCFTRCLTPKRVTSLRAHLHGNTLAGSTLQSVLSFFVLQFAISVAGIAARILIRIQGSEEKE